jgi:cation transport regulator
MPFDSIDDLPMSLRSRLPEHAKEIFRAAFNSAWATYTSLPPDKRDEICHRIAWSAVKKEYRKAGNFWISR